MCMNPGWPWHVSRDIGCLYCCCGSAAAHLAVTSEFEVENCLASIEKAATANVGDNFACFAHMAYAAKVALEFARLHTAR